MGMAKIWEGERSCNIPRGWTSSLRCSDSSLQVDILLSGFCILLCFSWVQFLSHVWLFATPWTAAHQASLSITNSQSLLRLMSIESVMPFNHLILCRPLLNFSRPSLFVHWGYDRAKKTDHQAHSLVGPTPNQVRNTSKTQENNNKIL